MLALGLLEYETLTGDEIIALDASLPNAVEPTYFLIFGDYTLILFLVVSLIVISRRRLHP